MLSSPALQLRADRPDFGALAQDGFAIDPRQRRRPLAGRPDGRAARRLVTQVRPLEG